MNRGIIRAVCLSLVALATGYVIAVRATASGRAEKTVVREWGDTAHVEETLTKVIATDGVKKVMVQSDFGSIAALPSTDGKVHLAAVTTISGQKYSEAELKALLKEVEIVVTTEGGTDSYPREAGQTAAKCWRKCRIYRARSRGIIACSAFGERESGGGDRA